MTRAATALAALALLAACEPRDEPPAAAPSPSPVETLPATYAGRENPLPDDEATVARGRALFVKTCAPCHGADANGKGPAAAGLVPPPANFHDGRLATMPDDRLFWRISTGKKGTAMPAFEGTLSEEDRWAILRYLRSIPPRENP